MLRIALALLIALSASSVAAAASELTIRAGETVTLQINESAITVLKREAAVPLSAFEAECLRKGQAIVVPQGVDAVPPVPFNHYENSPPAITPGQLRITFRGVPAPAGNGTQSLLTLENGYGQSVLYRTVMHQGQRAAPTDVCEVPPLKPGFEQWPFQLDSLDLSDFRLVAFVDGQIRCQ